MPVPHALVARAGLLGAAMIGSLLASPGRAAAGFDPRTGRVRLDEAAAALPFDRAGEAERLGPAVFLDGRLQPVSLRERDFERDADAVIEGEGALVLSEDVGGLAVVLDGAAEALRDRRIDIRVWYRPQGTYPVIELVYLERGGVDVLSDQTAFFAPLGSVRLVPTGRGTDDGWIELATGPVDYRLAGAVEARVLRIFDARAWERALSRGSALEGTALVDGLEIVDLGPARYPAAACSRVTEASACGDGACFLGRCVDPKPVLGNVPSSPTVRSDALERQIARFRAFAGGRVPQSNLQRFEDRLRSIQSETNLARYWSVYRRAHDDVADGHLSEPSDRLVGGGGSGACIHLGELDVLEGPGARGHLVYATASGHPVGDRLRPGDALVAIDGISVDAWVARSDRDLRYGGDPRGRTFIVAPDILNAALAAGSTLRFRRCNTVVDGRCPADATETIEIDGAALAAPILSGSVPDWWRGGLECDFRFARPLGIGTIGRERVRFTDLRGLRTIAIDGVIGFGQWRRDARDATTNLPSQVILDQRTGGGGTFQGVTALASPFLSTNEQPVALMLPWVTGFGARERAQFVRCLDGGQRTQCGNAFAEPLQGSRSPPSRVPAARLALINGRDVSGNDYLAKVLRDRSEGATRIFGAVPTYGAFGPIFSLPRILDEQRGGSVQLQDTLFVRDAMDTNLDFTTGIGVPPDEVVLQRQSDALEGRDTLFEAARAWVIGGAP